MGMRFKEYDITEVGFRRSYRREDIPVDMADRIEHMMKDIDRRMSVSDLAQKYDIKEQLAEDIARMYLTHPGIDTQGILSRLGI